MGPGVDLRIGQQGVEPGVGPRVGRGTGPKVCPAVGQGAEPGVGPGDR